QRVTRVALLSDHPERPQRAGAEALADHLRIGGRQACASIWAGFVERARLSRVLDCSRVLSAGVVRPRKGRMRVEHQSRLLRTPRLTDQFLEGAVAGAHV